MMLCRNRGRLFTIIELVLLASLFFALDVYASSKNGASFSPVHELGPSLAASVAGGTVIAVRSSFGDDNGAACNDISLKTTTASNDDESIVLLFRSPNDSSSNRGDVGRNLTVASVFGSVDTNNKLHYQPEGLAFLPNGPVSQPFLSNRNNNVRVLHANSGLVMAASGFASDAEHLINIAAGRVLSRISVYDAPSSSSLTVGKSVDPHRLVREDMSPIMIDAAMSDGGRPWGVQLLVVGQSTISRDQLLDIYTIDPTGGWRHRHGSIAAIGRGAERISLLGGELTQWRSKSRGWRGALEVALNATIHTFEKSDDISSDDALKSPSERYSAVVIFGNCGKRRGASRCASVCPSVIDESYKYAKSFEGQEEDLLS